MTEPIPLPSGATVQLRIPGPPTIIAPAPAPTTVMMLPVPGLPGPSSAGSHTHTQTTPSAVWDVTHDLGQMLVEAAAVYNLDYSEQYTGVIVEPLTTTTCRLFFGSPVSGRALIQG